MVVAILALVLAMGAGAAYAKSHFIITKKSQIKPSVLKALRGAKGANGARGTDGVNGTNGAAGITGATGAAGSAGAPGPAGATGGLGPAGPGAAVLADVLTSPGSIGSSTTSAAVGTLPIQLACTNEGANAPVANLETTAHSSGGATVRYDATWVSPAAGTSFTSPTLEQANGNLPATGTYSMLDTALADTGGADVTYGTVYLSDVPNSGAVTNETVTFQLTSAGSTSSSECAVSAQIVPSS
ncbi:MAG TPA: hypothetical protein VGG41_15635 [Solirubrobacteraceae bacterium]|jgi:hypothetical protein